MEFLFEKNTIEILAKILISAAFGIALGLERKNHLQAIGMRTLLLISVSCTLMGVLSYWWPSKHFMGDPMRIAAGVLTGIGFIGGGAIMHQGFNIKGITTAAIIWTTAALGLAVGFGLYVPAFFVFVLAFIGLLVLQKIEDKFFPAKKIKTISLVCKGELDAARTKEIFLQNGIIIRDIDFSKNYQDDTLSATILANTPGFENFEKLSAELKEICSLQEFSIGN